MASGWLAARVELGGWGGRGVAQESCSRRGPGPQRGRQRWPRCAATRALLPQVLSTRARKDVTVENIKARRCVGRGGGQGRAAAAGRTTSLGLAARPGCTPTRTHSLYRRLPACPTTPQVAVCVFAFDCLSINGRTLLRAPLTERREALYSALTALPGRLEFATAKVGGWAAGARMCGCGVEGRAGRRGRATAQAGAAGAARARPGCCPICPPAHPPLPPPKHAQPRPHVTWRS